MTDVPKPTLARYPLGKLFSAVGVVSVSLDSPGATTGTTGIWAHRESGWCYAGSDRGTESSGRFGFWLIGRGLASLVGEDRIPRQRRGTTVLLCSSVVAIALGFVDGAVAASWTPKPVPAPLSPSGSLAVVSCPSASFCVAVGTRATRTSQPHHTCVSSRSGSCA